MYWPLISNQDVDSIIKNDPIKDSEKNKNNINETKMGKRECNFQNKFNIQSTDNLKIYYGFL